MSKTVQMARVVNGLARQQVSTVPFALFRILEVGRDPNAGASDLAAVVERDQASAARMLRVANSGLYAGLSGTRVESIDQAIVRIGFHTAREIALSATVCTLFRSTKALRHYSLEGLWHHSLSVAAAARLVYSSVGLNLGYDPYLSGLLHDFGIVLEHQFLFEYGFALAVNAQCENDTDLRTEEHAHLGITHEEVGAEIARLWDFPSHIRTVIRHHHEWGNCPDGDILELVHAVRVAEWMCHELHYGYSDLGARTAESHMRSASAIGLDEQLYATIKEQLSVECEHMNAIHWFQIA